MPGTEAPRAEADFAVYRVELVRERARTFSHIAGPEDVAAVLSQYLERADREHFVVVMLATSGELIGLHTAHIGSLCSSVVGIAETFKAAILANAAAIIVAHNHPSGNLEPSRADLAITRKLQEAGELLGIPVHDSLIIGHDGAFTSLARRGLMQ